MMSNQVIAAMMARKSIRRYRPDQPTEEEVGTVVRAGQQAPFALQLCSMLLSRRIGENPFNAPLLFTICVDSHRLQLVMAQRHWDLVMNDLALLLLGIQDASLAAENMVIAGESLGMGSCFLGGAPYEAEEIAEKYKLPQRVFPLVQLAMGYPAEDVPPRPRYPISFALFEDEYPDLNSDTVKQAMKQMDEGYIAQGYYLKPDVRVPLESGREEAFTEATYGWTEHISRKAGQWYGSPEKLLREFAKRGFRIPGHATGPRA